MKRIIAVAVIAASFGFSLIAADQGKHECCTVKADTVKTVKTTEVDAIVAGKSGSYTLLDARTDKYFDGKIIPGASHLSADSNDKDISKALPDKDAKIVTYCAGPKCPASKQLADKLKSLGYKNVIEYTEGIEGWKSAGKELKSSK